MNYTIPDNRPFITKGRVKMKTRKTPIRKSLDGFFSAYSISLAHDKLHDTAYIKAELKK